MSEYYAHSVEWK